MSTGTQTEVVMPQMGVSVSEGTVTKWLRQVGEPIQRDEPLLEISTDKVDTEVPSPAEGVVAEIRVQEGETVEVGTVLALIAPAGAEIGAPEAAPERTPRPQRLPPSPSRRPLPRPRARSLRPLRAARGSPHRAGRRRPLAAPAATGNGKTFVSPVVARIAAEHGVDPVGRPGHGNRRARDEEGHPRVHRVRRGSGTSARRASAGSRRASRGDSASQSRQARTEPEPAPHARASRPPPRACRRARTPPQLLLRSPPLRRRRPHHRGGAVARRRARRSSR